VVESSLAGVVFCLEGLLNHELPQENRPVQGTKQSITANRKMSTKDKAESYKVKIQWIFSTLP